MCGGAQGRVLSKEAPAPLRGRVGGVSSEVEKFWKCPPNAPFTIFSRFYFEGGFRPAPSPPGMLWMPFFSFLLVCDCSLMCRGVGGPSPKRPFTPSPRECARGGPLPPELPGAGVWDAARDPHDEGAPPHHDVLHLPLRLLPPPGAPSSAGDGARGGKAPRHPHIIHTITVQP